jgi:hypothetical protein
MTQKDTSSLRLKRNQQNDTRARTNSYGALPVGTFSLSTVFATFAVAVVFSQTTYR